MADVNEAMVEAAFDVFQSVGADWTLMTVKQALEAALLHQAVSVPAGPGEPVAFKMLRPDGSLHCFWHTDGLSAESKALGYRAIPLYAFPTPPAAQSEPAGVKVTEAIELQLVWGGDDRSWENGALLQRRVQTRIGPHWVTIAKLSGAAIAARVSLEAALATGGATAGAGDDAIERRGGQKALRAAAQLIARDRRSELAIRYDYEPEWHKHQQAIARDLLAYADALAASPAAPSGPEADRGRALAPAEIYAVLYLNAEGEEWTKVLPKSKFAVVARTLNEAMRALARDPVQPARLAAEGEAEGASEQSAFTAWINERMGGLRLDAPNMRESFGAGFRASDEARQAAERDVRKWHEIAMKLGCVVCTDGSWIDGRKELVAKANARAEAAEARVETAEAESTKLQAALENAEAFIGGMFGQGPDALIPEHITAPLGVSVRLGDLMRDIRAALQSAAPAATSPQQTDRAAVLEEAAQIAEMLHEEPLHDQHNQVCRNYGARVAARIRALASGEQRS